MASQSAHILILARTPQSLTNDLNLVIQTEKEAHAKKYFYYRSQKEVEITNKRFLENVLSVHFFPFTVF